VTVFVAFKALQRICSVCYEFSFGRSSIKSAGSLCKLGKISLAQLVMQAR